MFRGATRLSSGGIAAMHDNDPYKSLAFAVCASLALGGGLAVGGCSPDNQEDAQAALHPSKSSTIALSEDGARVAMVNPDDGSLSVFAAADGTRTAKIATGGEPSSVVIAPDSKTAFVANRADGT